MYFIQYFKTGIVSGKLIEACGDRSIIITNGKNSLETMNTDAVKFNGQDRPVYKAYQIRKGENILRCKSITKIISL